MGLSVLVIADLAVMLGAGLALFARRVHDNKPVKATHSVLIGRASEVVAIEVLQALLHLPHARLEALTPYRSVLIVTRTASWAVLPAIWLFPVGLLFLLRRREVRLEVAFYRSQMGTLVQLSGPTETALLRRARAAVEAVPGSRQSIRVVGAQL